MSALSLGTRHDGARTVLALAGDLDLATVTALREAAIAELDADHCRELVLDLAGLDFLDSTGLGCWIDLRNEAADRGKSLRLERMPAIAGRTVTLAGLAELFGVATIGHPAGETSAT